MLMSSSNPSYILPARDPSSPCAMRRYIGQDQTIIYRHDRFHTSDFEAREHVITAVIVSPTTPREELMSVWSRGRCAGSLRVERGDGEEIARRLLGPLVTE